MRKALNTLSPAGKNGYLLITTHHLTDITRCERVWVCGCVGVWACGRRGGGVREEAGLPVRSVNSDHSQILKRAENTECYLAGKERMKLDMNVTVACVYLQKRRPSVQ